MEVRATDDFFQHRYYRITKMELKLTGQWPCQSIRTRYFFIALALMVTASIMVPVTIDIVKHRDDWDFLIQCVTLLTFGGVLVTKFFFSTFNSKKMLRLLDRMRTDWDILARDCNVDILHEHAEKGRKMTIAYAVVAYITCFIFGILPIVPKIIDILLRNGTEPGEFPIPVDYLFIDEQEYYFYIVLNYFVAGSMAFMALIAHDSLFMVYVHHCCGLYAVLGRADTAQNWHHTGCQDLSGGTARVLKTHRINIVPILLTVTPMQTYLTRGPSLYWSFGATTTIGSVLGTYWVNRQFLQNKLKHIGKNKRSGETCEIEYTLHKTDMDFKDVASCIDRHNEAIEYAELINATYSWCFLFVVGLDMFLIAITGLQIFRTTIEPQDALRFFIGNVFVVVRLYAECYMAQILMDHSISIRNYMLNSEWYRLPLKTQKLLLLMMMRCNVPCYITAGKFCIMSLETFQVILKTSVSYFTLLRSI